MEIIIGILAVLVIVLYYISHTVETELRGFKKEFKNFKLNTEYKLLLPQIEEYAKLSGLVNGHFRNYEHIYFRNENSNNTVVDLYDIENKLAEMKKAIEIACPKKCAKKK